MSDLHRAVEDEIDAFRPDRTPPFAAVLARRRARDRRRTATGAAALSVVAVAGIVLLPSILSGGEDRLPSYANPNPTQAADQELAERLCADAAQEYDGEVAAAYATTVQDVRNYMADPHDTEGDPSVGPIPGPYSYPAGWTEKAPGDTAAACYINADIPIPSPPGALPADRALIMTSEGATTFMATAGPKENLPPAPLPDPTSGSDGIRYSITYDSEAVYKQHVEAVQACLDLPGISDVSADYSMPPGVGVIVTGSRQNTGFQKCLSGLAGVTFTALIPYDPTTAPDEFINRSSLPSCGQHLVGHGSTPRAAIDCFADAFGGPAGAEYAVSRLSQEGDPVVAYYRALPGQQVVEVFLDNSRDTFGSQRWLQATCTGYDATIGQATGCPPNGTGHI